MKELLIQKVKKAEELKRYTEEIVSTSLKTDYVRVQSMIDARQAFFNEIDEIDAQIKEINRNSTIIETNEIRELKKELRKNFKEVSELDNIIRKNITEELKNVKKILNKPEAPTKLLNLKA